MAALPGEDSAAAAAGGSSSNPFQIGAGVVEELDNIQRSIAKVEQEISATANEIETGEKALEGEKAYKKLSGEKLEKLLDAMRREKEQLRREKEQLRAKEEQLRAEKLILLSLRKEERGQRPVQGTLPPAKRVRTGAEFDALAGIGGSLPTPTRTWADQLLPPRLQRAQLPKNINQLRELLMSRTDICIPLVPDLYAHIARDTRRPLSRHLLVGGDGSSPCVQLSALVDPDKTFLAGPTEIPTTAKVFQFFDVVFGVLSEFSRLSLPYRLNFNRRETGTSGAVILDRKRPDMLIVVNSCSLLFGEDKAPENLVGAVADLQSKFTCVNIHHYGDVRFLLAYAASGTQIQFHGFFQNQRFASVSDIFDMARPQGRIELICTLAQVYVLLHLMSECVPKLADRTAIFQEMRRADGCTVMVTSGYVVKIIKPFEKFASKFGVVLSTVQSAYRAAGASAGEWLVKSRGLPPRMEGAAYYVETVPVGYLPPDQYSDVRAVTWGCCKALCVLHAKGLVHRDIRPENMLCRAPGKWMLIDLELVTTAGTAVKHDPLRSWTKDTLEEPGGVYTCMSDMHQVGCMVERLLGEVSASITEMSEQNMQRAAQFVADLKSRRLTAEQAVQHEWFTGDTLP